MALVFLEESARRGRVVFCKGPVFLLVNIKVTFKKVSGIKEKSHRGHSTEVCVPGASGWGSILRHVDSQSSEATVMVSLLWVLLYLPGGSMAGRKGTDLDKEVRTRSIR